jgi:cytochrome c
MIAGAGAVPSNADDEPKQADRGGRLMLRTTTVLAVLMLSAGNAFAQGDVAAGETVFKKCGTCHAVGEGAKTKVGPVLNDVFGRTAGTLEGFKFSPAMVKAGEEGLVWTHETMAEFLAKPRDYVPGTRMAYPGLPKPEDIANVIAYLETFSPDYVPAE